MNEIIVNFADAATIIDAQRIATLVGGRIVGIQILTNGYKIEVPVTTVTDLTAKIQLIQNLNSPLIEGEFRNYVLNLLETKLDLLHGLIMKNSRVWSCNQILIKASLKSYLHQSKSKLLMITE